MKTYIKLFIALLFASTTISCSDNLDENVYSSVTEQSYKYTSADFDPAVSSVYSYLRSLISHGGYWQAQEVTADGIVMPPNASGWDDGGIYRRMHYHTWNSEQAHISSMWSAFYRGVILSNQVIEQIETDKIPALSANDKTAGLAELRAARAFYYWLICDNFGDAPLVTATGTDLPEKSTRKQIYDFIVSELNEVIPSLSEVQGGTSYGRMNKWAAKALLANVYLNAEVYVGEPHWADCIIQCNDIINSTKCDLSANYSDPFRTVGVETSKEIIFTIPFDEKLAGGNSIHMFSWHGELKKKYETEATPWGSGSAMGVTQFIDTYDTEDSRLADTWLMGPQYAANGTLLLGTYDMKGEPLNFTKDIPSGNYTKEAEGYRMNKYEIVKGAQGSSSTDVPLFRYSEVLLMKAECLLRTGAPGAGELVTQVRRRAFKDNPDKAVVTDAQLLENSSYQYGYVEDYKIVDKGNTDPILYGRMLDELGWEFAWEMHRRRDMIRFGVYTKKSWLSHKPQGEYRKLFPIPESVITSNPMLTQNPDYSN
nr:RagB/SusD family nutrient uptake outer membrane protein [uncultured Macellibacteroides sp.]